MPAKPAAAPIAIIARKAAGTATAITGLRPARQGGPQADADHGQQMVQAGEGMQEARGPHGRDGRGPDRPPPAAKR